MRRYGMTLQDIARQTGLAEHTVRQYAKRGVFEWLRDPSGRIRCEAAAARKCRAHYLQRGAPGGRPVRIRSEAADG